jgi:tRNA G18 (ribose-2'-O)-methylase SpoU
MAGYFEIGLHEPRHEQNIGTLWRSAYQLGAAGLFIIGGLKYKRQSTDTYCAPRHIPLRHYATFTEYLSSKPEEMQLVAIEQGGVELSNFRHPKQCSYLLGSEDEGLPTEIIEQCRWSISLESVNQNSYNVAIAGSIVMYHRIFL